MQNVLNPGDKAVGEAVRARRVAMEELNPKSGPTEPEKKTPVNSPVDRIHPEGAPYGTQPGEKRIDVRDMVKPLGSFKEGGKVKKTGAYILHKDEKVVPAEGKSEPKSEAKKEVKQGEEKMATPYDMITGGKKAPKTIQKHEYHRTHNGKHVVTHKHHDPAHKDEQHMFEKFGDAADHMEQNPPQPEPAEAAAPAAGGAAMPPAAGM